MPKRFRVASFKFVGKRLVDRLEPALAPALALAWLVSIALSQRARDVVRRQRRAKARVIWGPSAILNIKYWSHSLREGGYDSITAVDVPAVISSREDWDFVRSDFGGSDPRAERWRSYTMFAWALRRGDVFIRFMDLGFLRYTPLEWLEYPLTRLAGKKLIVTSYGGDIAVAGHLGRFEEVTFEDYPDLEGQAELFTRRIHHSLRWANLTVRNQGLGYVPAFDAVALNQLTVDTERWRESRGDSGNDGMDGPVSVVHAPNHRRIKGTHHLEQAVRDLRAEGLDIDLRIMEKRGNEEVRAAVVDSDVVADQFYGGYGLFAVEGMAAAKPVIGNLTMEWLPEEFLAAKAEQGCPIVDSDPDRLRDDLRSLVVDPERRRELGRAGREFVMRHHSYEAVGEMWGHFVDHVWNRRPLPPELLPQSKWP